MNALIFFHVSGRGSCRGVRGLARPQMNCRLVNFSYPLNAAKPEIILGKIINDHSNVDVIISNLTKIKLIIEKVYR